MKRKIIILFLVLMVVVLVSPFVFIKIKLIGDKEFYLNYGDAYSEPGFKATIFGKNISEDVKVEGSVQSELGEYKLTYSYHFFFYTIQKTRMVIVKDIEGPKIEFNGSTTYDTIVGEEYVDPGFTAYDNLDGDLTSNVKVSSNVNSAELGQYVVTYVVTDNAGNKTTKERIVNVVKKNPTQMTIEEYSLDGWYDECKLKETVANSDDYFNSIIMVGDSNTMNMYLLGHLQSKNAWAIPCLHAYDMLNKKLNLYGHGTQMNLFDATTKYSPQKMIINFGSFSTVWIEEEVFIQSATQIIERLKKESPDTEIALISIYPITKNGPNINEFKQETINRLNFLILELANKYNVNFLDVQDVLKDNTGYGNQNLYEYDGFHLNTYGQAKVKEYIESHRMGD